MLSSRHASPLSCCLHPSVGLRGAHARLRAQLDLASEADPDPSRIKRVSTARTALSLLSPHRRELFHSNSGARENALKILVVITDGEKYGDPLEYRQVIPEADREGVIRYVIGVGSRAPRLMPLRGFLLTYALLRGANTNEIQVGTSRLTPVWVCQCKKLSQSGGLKQ